MPRIPYVEPDMASEDVKGLYDRVAGIAGGDVGNIFKTMANAPDIMLQFMRMGTAILQRSSLDPRLRELAILRNAQQTRAVYEYAHHVPIGLDAGVKQEQVENLAKYATHPAFSEEERAVIAFAEEVGQQVRASDAAFERVSKYLDTKQLVELTVTVGFYGMVSRFLETMDVRPEPAFEQYVPDGWPDR